MDFVIWFILGFAAYRITRLLVIDTIFELSRAKFYSFLANRQGKLSFIWQKTLYLTSCTWCLGFWVCLALYSVYVWGNPTDFSRLDWINVFAVSGVQGLLHAFEPSEE